MTALSLSLIVATPSCDDDTPEVVVGERGEKGDKGDKGDRGVNGTPGNANVKRFTFTVKADEWYSGSHFGSSNNHTYFQVKPELTGNISIGSSDYIVLAYANPIGSGADYREKKQLPYRFNVNNNYGIILELLPNRGYLTMSKTTNGFNYNAVPLNERPVSITYTIILIEIGTVNALKGKVDLKNYAEVSSYFNLN